MDCMVGTHCCYWMTMLCYSPSSLTLGYATVTMMLAYDNDDGINELTVVLQQQPYKLEFKHKHLHEGTVAVLDVNKNLLITCEFDNSTTVAQLLQSVASKQNHTPTANHEETEKYGLVIASKHDTEGFYLPNNRTLMSLGIDKSVCNSFTSIIIT